MRCVSYLVLGLCLVSPRCLCFMHQWAQGVVFQQHDEDIKAESGTAINLKHLDGLSSVTSPTLPIKFHQKALHGPPDWKEIHWCGVKPSFLLSCSFETPFCVFFVPLMSLRPFSATITFTSSKQECFKASIAGLPASCYTPYNTAH